ncbi:hypothetical protein QQ045_013574 [Rhodiola kirilowii]
MTEAESPERCITHYSISNKILLVGEGDFSFGTCLARAFGSAKNITATSLDPIVMKYNDARDNLRKLLELGCHIIHGVDALYMRRQPALRAHKFDRIVFNFPHAGFQYREDDQRQITLAKKCRLRLVKKRTFIRSDYPGYNNKRGAGVDFDKSFPIGQCKTFVFTNLTS